ncbi:MAG: alpha/beta hydrolase, partial [Ilumatobacteraceae bacterium]
MATPVARLDTVWLALVATGIALVSATDGSPGWCILRLVVIATLCGGVAIGARRWHPAASAIALVAVGTIAATVGGTIGVSYLTTTGLTVKSAGGLLALAGGVGAIATGATRLVRRSRGWRRALVVPIAAVTGYAVVMPLAIAVYATNVPRPSLGSTTPADVGLDFVDAVLTTSDGVRLSGWYVPSANGAAVVLLHGASSTRSNVLGHAAVLARHGYGVLLYDARGHGRSDGRAMELGWYGDLDVAAAVDFLAARPDVDARRIGAIGMSMGGEQVIGALAADDRLVAAVAEGATNR